MTSRQASETVGTGRPPVAKRRIVSELRKGIQAGALARGSRLPSQDELAARFGVTKVTVNAAMRTLAECGFIEAGPRGSYVATRLPADDTYGVYFPRTALGLEENAFWTALHVAATSPAHRPGTVKLRPYYLDENVPLPSNPCYRQLVFDVTHGCLRGLICTAPPYRLDGTPVLAAAGMGYAGTFLPGGRWPQFMGLHLANDLFATKALDYLAACGRRRVAHILPPVLTAAAIDRLATDMRSRGLAYRSHWLQALSVHDPQWARHCAQLLFHADQNERPDGLVIWDDNMVGPATTGLLDVGVRVPDDVTVVAHCNYPVVTRSAVPARRLGYDACEALHCCLALVERRLADEAPGQVATITPVFDDERKSRAA